MNVDTNHAVKAEINVTPLVDVVLVLLIIFMVVMPIMVSQGIQLPAGPNAKKVNDADKVKSISLTSEGLLFYEQEPVSESGLQDRLRELFDRNQEAQIILRADRRVVYGDVHRILDMAAGAGFHNLSLMADPGDHH